MARKLDRKRPFAQVYGHAAAAFEQFGILFNANGTELPGFEKVEIPEVTQHDAADSSATEELTAEIARLAGENARLRAELEEKDAELEEVAGKADTLEVENHRLAQQLAAISAPPEVVETAPVSPDAPPPKNKKQQETAVQTSLDAQLQAQGVM